MAGFQTKHKMLELFSGMKCIGTVFEQNGYEVTSLDYVQKLNPTICCDILTWDYKSKFKPGDFDVIWASPDCTTWSIASGGKHRKKSDMIPKTEKAKLGERLVWKTLEIIAYFKPDAWFIENPRGLMRHFPPMMKLEKTYHRTTVYYGTYEWDMVKPTDIWSNIPMWENEKQPIMPEHTYTIKVRSDRERRIYNRTNKGYQIMSEIPPKLIERIYKLEGIPK